MACSIARGRAPGTVAALACALAGVAVFAGCETVRSSGVSEYYSGNYAAARAVYQENLKAEPKSRALYLLRLGTLELDSGRVQQAREDFIQATGIMQDFKASGQFKAIVGAESSKEYKGDPYEQMMALWYLGVIDYMLGDYNMALPSFKSAALADGGTTDERYKSDAASIFLMMARAYQAMGDKARSDDEYSETEGVYTFRQTVDLLSRSLAYARSQVYSGAANPRAVDAAYGFLAEGSSAGATQEQDPARALSAATDYAFEALRKAAASRGESARLLGQDQNVIGGCIKDLSAAASAQLSAGGAASQSPLGAIVARARDRANNLVVLVGIGQGPFKYRTGEYGEMARFGRRDYPERYAEVFVDGVSVGRTEMIEDVYYQAATRGGRAMDGVLRGKAVFKDVTKFGAGAALAVAAVSERRRTRNTALIAAAALLASSLATRPEADVRSWETLPDEIQILTARVAPGIHGVEVRFYGPGGGLIPGMTRLCPRAVVSNGRDTLVYVRAGAAAPACLEAGTAGAGGQVEK